MDARQFELIKQDIAEIKTALIGNEITNDGGMVHRLDNVEKTVNELKKFKDRSTWAASLLIAVAAGFGWVFDRVIEVFIKH